MRWSSAAFSLPAHAGIEYCRGAMAAIPSAPAGHGLFLRTSSYSEHAATSLCKSSRKSPRCATPRTARAGVYFQIRACIYFQPAASEHSCHLAHGRLGVGQFRIGSFHSRSVSLTKGQPPAPPMKCVHHRRRPTTHRPIIAMTTRRTIPPPTSLTPATPAAQTAGGGGRREPTARWSAGALGQAARPWSGGASAGAARPIAARRWAGASWSPPDLG